MTIEVVAVYFLVGLVIGLAAAANLYIHSEGSQALIIMVCIIVVFGMMFAWLPLAILYVMYRALGGGFSG